MFEFLLIADWSGFFLGLLGVILFLISVFLVFIILIQRGKGGGIAGSLTGTAQSAFGARGGDILMWLTLTLTIVWILLCCVTIFFYSRVQDSIAEGSLDADIQAETDSTLPDPVLPPEAALNGAGNGDSTDGPQQPITPATETNNDANENQLDTNEDSEEDTADVSNDDQPDADPTTPNDQ